MRYATSHKQLTKRRIVQAASRMIRERGVAETGVDQVMRVAGLTHGGFYSHFADKSELIVEACAAAFGEAAGNLDRIGALPTASRRARMLIDSYLTFRHRDNRGSGCVAVAVGADIPRLSGAAKTSYSAQLVGHLDRLEQVLRLDPDPARNRRLVTHLITSLVGSLLFARALADPERSGGVLLEMRRQLRREFCQGGVRGDGHPTRACNDFLNAI